MDLRNKTFKNNRTGELVTVIDSFENIAILENKEKIDVRRLINNDFFTEQVDPKNFFNNQFAYNSLAEKIKNIPLNQIRDDEQSQNVQISTPYNESFNLPTNESAIVMSSEEDERAELARKYGVQSNPVSDIQRQNEAFAKLLGEDNQDLPTLPIQTSDDVVTVEVQREVQRGETVRQVPVSVEDPIITMFKKTKRNVDFSISFEITNKIPRVDFIELMEDSYEVSIIDFLANEFTDRILEDPTSIKNKIKEKIREMVYGKSTEKVQNEKSETEKVQTISKPKRARTPKKNTDEK